MNKIEEASSVAKAEFIALSPGLTSPRCEIAFELGFLAGAQYGYSTRNDDWLAAMDKFKKGLLDIN